MERRLELATTEGTGRDNQELSLTREKTPKVSFWNKMAIVLYEIREVKLIPNRGG